MTAIAVPRGYSQTDYAGLACLPGLFEPAIYLPPTPSNHVDTPLGASIGDLVWADVDGDGVRMLTSWVWPASRFAPRPPPAGPDPRPRGHHSPRHYTLGGLTNGTSYATVTLSTVPPGYVPTTPTTLTVTATTAGTLTADFGLAAARHGHHFATTVRSMPTKTEPSIHPERLARGYGPPLPGCQQQRRH